MVTAAAMIAQQVAGRAARDALFLSHFDVTRLPAALVGAALLAMLLALALARAMSARGPARVVPAAFGASAALTLIEWAFAARAPAAIAVVVFLHVSAFGTVLASCFWSQIGETFDPRTARRKFGAIGAAGTLGGIAGGVLAAQMAGHFAVFSILPVLAALHLACAFAASGCKALVQPPPTAPGAARRSGARVFVETPLLRDIALLTVTVSVSAVLLDYVFKARAAAALPRGADLLRMFSGFYAAVALLTFLAQAGLSRWFLEGAGLARTTAVLPAGIALGGAGALLLPGFASATVARGLEAVLRSSLFRSGYELLFTPLSAAERRATKTLVDVGFDRLGDMLGGGGAALLLLLGPVIARDAMLGASVAIALGGVAIALRLHRSYVAALERGLLRGAIALDAEEVQDRTTRDTMIVTLGSRGIDVSALRAEWRARPAETATPRASILVSEPPAGAQPAVPPAPDLELARLAALRSGDPARATAALMAGPLDAVLVAHAIPLLARDAVAAEALRTLRAAAPRVTGQLVDALLDPETDFAVRRRLPRALTAGDPERAIEGLLRGLEDVRFEVRFHCGRAVARIRERHTALALDPDRIFAAAIREARLGREMPDPNRPGAAALDPRPGSDADLAATARARQGLDHVFTLLALVLPGEPLRVARRALESRDAILRGTALEYLESTLPPAVRAELLPALEARGPVTRPARPREQVLDELMRSTAAVRIEAPKPREGSPDP